jgi:hypothetical protein
LRETGIRNFFAFSDRLGGGLLFNGATFREDTVVNVVNNNIIKGNCRFQSTTKIFVSSTLLGGCEHSPEKKIAKSKKY